MNHQLERAAVAQSHGGEVAPERNECGVWSMASRKRWWSGALSTSQSMSAPVSQMSAAALPAGTKQLALVAALGQRSDDPRTARLGMASVLLQHQGQVLADEFRTRNLALASGAGEQPIVVWIQRDRGRFLPR
jgi:hypothetical protein